MLRYHIHSYIARCIAIMLASLPWFAQYIQIQCFSLNCSVFDIWMHISTELSLGLGLQVGHCVGMASFWHAADHRTVVGSQHAARVSNLICFGLLFALSCFIF